MAISFFNIHSGETRVADTPELIAGFMNSSDLGVNSRVGQDFGWRVAPEHAARLRLLREDKGTLDRISQRYKINLEDIQDHDILRWISDENPSDRNEENQEINRQNAYEEKYEKAVAAAMKAAQKAMQSPQKATDTTTGKAAAGKNDDADGKK